MRKLILALLAATGAAMVATTPAAAVGTRHAFCLQGENYPALSDCSFNSYEECQASASGRLLTCIANPYYVPGGAPPAHYHPRHHHRHPH
jgi:hypothetical protein